MKMLMFQARRFAWHPFQRSSSDAVDQDAGAEVLDAIVVFVHVEANDGDQAAKIVTRAAKNIKWLAGKSGLRKIVLHSFTHLGGETAPSAVACSLLERMADRLRGVAYEVWLTPFGWVCEWELSVYGESLAKVFKAL